MEATQNTGRRIAIVGRPNVGKSSIFNRIAGRRIAIVHAERGVTRDRLMREVTWNDQRFTLIDTGGVCNIDAASTPDTIDAGIMTQVQAALAEASVALFVVDVTAGITPLDEEVARLLRQAPCKVFLLANKTDDTHQETGAAEFEKFGYPVTAVSAIHGRGIEDVMAQALAALPPAGDEPTLTDPLKIAVVGRPNAGKSSYINRLLRSDRLLVTSIPGTTRDSIDIPFQVGSGPQARHYLLIDTAGFRHFGQLKTAVDRFSHMRAEKSIRRADIVLLVLDATQGPSLQDRKIAAFIQEHGKGCLVLVNKWDLAEGETTQTQYGPALEKAMPFMGYCPILFASAKTGYNIRRTIEAIDHVAAQVRTALPTHLLTQVILDAFDRSPPPLMSGKRLKAYYATQAGKAPVKIRIFVNDPKRLPKTYEAYLMRSIRAKFGLEGAPLILQFKPRRPTRGAAPD